MNRRELLQMAAASSLLLHELARGAGVAGERFGVYDFGLSAAQETRAARLHRDSIVIDLLFQGPCGYRCFTPEVLELARQSAPEGTPLEKYFATVFAPARAALQGKLPEFQLIWEQSGITAGNRQVGYGLPAYAIAQAQFDTFPWMIKALRAADIRAAKAAGKRAGFISTQDSDGLQERKLDHLRAAYDLGLRMMGLSYNVQNAVAGGLSDRFDGGVTAYGAEVIRKMDQLGIIVDMSHSSSQATLDACSLSKHPVVISHASAAALRAVPRAKSDAVIRAIAATGGVFGVVTVPTFLSADEHPTIDAMLDHIDYIVQLVGWQHVAIGTDWPLQVDRQTLEGTYPAMARQFNVRSEEPKAAAPREPASLIGFDDYRDFPNITRGLVKRGYSDERIRGILGENFLRVFAQVCG
jgi:membrane dipeptidase